MLKQYAKADKNNPSPTAQCDRSGFVFNRKDMDFQYEWRGDAYVNTGLLVGKIFLDEANEQSRPPKIKADPKSVVDPRVPQNYTPAPEALPINELIDKLNKYKWS